MLDQGFLDEVRDLRARGDLHRDLPSMRAVGYRQAWEYLDGDYGAGPAARTAMRERGIAATRQLAKRQLTWLRSLPMHTRIDCLADDAAEQCIAVLRGGLHALRTEAGQPWSPYLPVQDEESEDL